jgi:hypothetical protein
MACGFPFFNRGCDFDRFRGCGLGACGCGGFEGCGRCGCDKDDKKISVITAVRAVCAQGEGCFDKVGEW